MAAWAMIVGCATVAAQDVTHTLFSPDSVFTLTDEDIEQDRIEANRLIAGTWQYDKPSVQAQGTSFIGKLGKPLAQSKLKSKLGKAFKKLKINKRWDSLTLTEDGRWIMPIAGKGMSGDYSYSPTKGSITLKWHMMSITALVRRDGKNLHLCFDSEKKFHQIYDALGRLIESKGLCIAPAHFFQQFFPVCVFTRKETKEKKRTQIKPRDRQRIDGGTTAGYPNNADAFFYCRLNQFVARVRDAGGAGIGDHSHTFALLQRL